MKKKVYNRTVGKVFRTLGFMLIFISSVYIFSRIVLDNAAISILNPIAPLAQRALAILDSTPLIGQYTVLAITAGFICLLWVIRRGIILRVTLTLLLLSNFVLAGFGFGLMPIIIFNASWIDSLILKIPSSVLNMLLSNEYILSGLLLVTPILMWALFAYKRPKRISAFFLRVGSTFLFLAVLMLGLALQFKPDLIVNDLFNIGYVGLYLLTYTFFIIGSALGIIGFSRK